MADSCLPLITFVAAAFLLFAFAAAVVPPFLGPYGDADCDAGDEACTKTRRACYVIGNERRRYVLSFRRLFFLDTPNSG